MYIKMIEQIDWDDVLPKLKELYGKEYKKEYIRKVIRGYVKNRTIEPALFDMGFLRGKK
jgi:hypothetical protein